MSDFIRITSNHGRIGRICWVNSCTRHPQQYQVWPYRHGGWWGSTYLCAPHPARPEEAW
jgi:hypothetical protein